MWETVVLVASQVAVQAVTWTLAFALAVGAVRRRERLPALPAAAAIVLLLGTAAAVIPQLSLVSGAAWWFALPVLLGTYPDGRFVPRWIAVPVAAYLVWAVAFVATAGAVAQDWGGLVGFSSLILLAAPVYRYLRRATTEERESVRWAILSVIVGVGLFALLAVVEGGTVAEHGPVSVAAANVIGVVIPSGFALGLLRPRLLDVDVLLAFVVTALVAVSVLGAAASLTWWLTSLVLPEGAFALSLIVVGAAATPTVLAGRRVADRLVFRGRRDEDAAVSALDARLAATADSAGAPAAVLESVVESLRLSGAELVGDIHLACARGTLAGAVESFPISYQGELLAQMRVGPRAGESSLGAFDRRVLARLALHAAPALAAARTHAELRDAHAAVLAAREEERRRLRRDLHDDLSPTLSGLGLSAAAISHLARRGQDVADAAGALVADVQAAARQAREIAYGLRPAVLDDQGLVAAIRSRVHGQHADRLRVSVEGADLPHQLPAAVDLAALRIVQEAVENTRRHGGAGQCEVRVTVRAGHLVLTVDDDGVGFPEQLHAGLGIASIRERTRELGGTAELHRSSLGGAGVRVRLPLTAVSS